MSEHVVETNEKGNTSLLVDNYAPKEDDDSMQDVVAHTLGNPRGDCNPNAREGSSSNAMPSTNSPLKVTTSKVIINPPFPQWLRKKMIMLSFKSSYLCLTLSWSISHRLKPFSEFQAILSLWMSWSWRRGTWSLRPLKNSLITIMLLYYLGAFIIPWKIGVS